MDDLEMELLDEIAKSEDTPEEVLRVHEDCLNAIKEKKYIFPTPELVKKMAGALFEGAFIENQEYESCLGYVKKCVGLEVCTVAEISIDTEAWHHEDRESILLTVYTDDCFYTEDEIRMIVYLFFILQENEFGFPVLEMNKEQNGRYAFTIRILDDKCIK
jgi:predicted HAD superfamily phosphohydrolase